MAEKCGLASELDFQILSQTCQLIKTDIRNTTYSVNFSIETLLSNNFVEKFLALLNTQSVSKARVIIEISEYHIHKHLSALLPILKRLHQAGIQILADKVGQYVVNSLYLNEGVIQHIKLHPSIVLNIDATPENQVFVKSIEMQCQSLAINIYAVGVETFEQWQTLTKLGLLVGKVIILINQRHNLRLPLVRRKLVTFQ